MWLTWGDGEGVCEGSDFWRTFGSFPFSYCSPRLQVTPWNRQRPVIDVNVGHVSAPLQVIDSGRCMTSVSWRWTSSTRSPRTPESTCARRPTSTAPTSTKFSSDVSVRYVTLRYVLVAAASLNALKLHCTVRRNLPQTYRALTHVHSDRNELNSTELCHSTVVGDE